MTLTEALAHPIAVGVFRRRTTPRALVRHAAALIVCLFLSHASTRAETIPANTPIEIRLVKRISTKKSKKLAPVEAILIAPVLSGDRVLLPAGSKVLGTIADLDSVRLGFYHETASIAIKMDRIVLPGGTSLPLAARVVEVENSREKVNKSGRIQGVRSTSTLSHRTSGAIGTIALGNPIALLFTTASSDALLRFSDPEISLPANAELILLLTEPVTVPDSQPLATPPVAGTPEEQHTLRTLVREQPFRTVTDTSHVPSDLTNLMFIGDKRSILRAFDAAGWAQVQTLDAASTYRTLRSITEQQAYRTAPMSTLLLEGQPPAATLAKTLDTFSKRHHLRVFATHDTWDGQPVWLSSSTQDIGIGFSKAKKTLIHQIDTNIDHERGKVVNDLMLTGCVTAINLIARPWLPKNMTNGTAETIVTDERMAVLRFNDCASPLHIPPLDQTDFVPIHSNVAARITRQTVLTLRNTATRDNVVVSAYSGIRSLIQIKKPKPRAPIYAMDSEISNPRFFLDNPAATSPELARRTPATPSAAAAPPPVKAAESRYPAPTVELGLHSGWAGFAGGNGGVAGFILTDQVDSINNPSLLLFLGNIHHPGWNLGGSVTVDSHKYFSNEFNFDYNRTGFQLFFVSFAGQSTDDATDDQFQFEDANLSTTEFSYNLLVHARPKGSRFRPYVSFGPSLRLMHLTEAPITKASKWFKLGLSTVGAITAAYKFGSTPPLDGGGIFQAGFQYGGGVQYRIARRWLIRADYRETLTGQPDFWGKSKDEISDDVSLPGYDLTVIGPIMSGVMRQQRVTTGLSFVF